MPPPDGSILRYLQIALATQRGETLTDAELLDRFVAGEEHAFAVLVSRHGPLVWRTCCRLLGDTTDAEDAFQASFLILARRASSLRRGPLAPWLYGTARHASLKARTSAARRQRREQVLLHEPLASAQLPDQADLRGVLDEELALLPEKLRVVVILIHVEGRTKTEVAQVLGVSFRAVAKRLDRAEQLLQERLGRRGLQVTGITLGALLATQTATAMPRDLVATTTQAAFAFTRTGKLTESAATELAAKLLAPRFPVLLVAFAITITVAVAALLPDSLAVEEKPIPTPCPRVVNAHQSQKEFDSGGMALLSKSPRPGLVISEIFTNPSGADSPFEYVGLIATRDIDFSKMAHSVVFTDTTGSPGPNGWVNGGIYSYGFNIASGTVSRGQVVYVGGSSMVLTGTQLRVINTATTEGNGFGAPRHVRVLGNGGKHADGVAIFDADINLVTASTAPVDAVLFGSRVGKAAEANYMLPVNDHYAGGIADANSFIAPDPGTNDVLRATGTFDPALGEWTVGRSWTLDKTRTSGMTLITLASPRYARSH